MNDSNEPTLTAEQERDEALNYLLNIVNAWRDVNRYRVYLPQEWQEKANREMALEAVLEEARQHLEAVQWM